MNPIARGWILYKPDPGLVKQETYEIDRIVAAAPENGYEVEIVSPDEIGLLVSSSQGHSVFLRGKEADLPDFVIPRMGSTTTYFAMAILRQLERLGVYCLNGSQAVELAQDKLFHLQVLLSIVSFYCHRRLFLQLRQIHIWKPAICQLRFHPLR